MSPSCKTDALGETQYIVAGQLCSIKFKHSKARLDPLQHSVVKNGFLDGEIFHEIFPKYLAFFLNISKVQIPVFS